MKTFNFKVMGNRWVMRVMPNSKYKKKNGKDSLATTHTNKRRIDVKKGDLCFSTIAHELVHAFFSETCAHQADLDADDIEEILAELFSRRGVELLFLAEKLSNKCGVMK